jgi:hypothetical protein
MTAPPISDAELDAIAARDDKRTPGEWHAYYTAHGDPFVNGQPGNGTGSSRIAAIATGPNDCGRANAEFIAHAAADVSRLVALVRVLREEIEGQEAVLAVAQRFTRGLMDYAFDHPADGLLEALDELSTAFGTEAAHAISGSVAPSPGPDSDVANALAPGGADAVGGSRP